MEERRLLCVRMKYSDCAWVEQLGAEGWDVQAVDDLTAGTDPLQAAMRAQEAIEFDA